jgi:hypothetical protein
MRLRSPRMAVHHLGAALLAACSSNSGTPPNPTQTMAMVAGDNQLTLLGTAVAIPPAVKVTDLDGQPVSGTTVTFAVVVYGLVTGATPVTGADGIATVGSWNPEFLGTHTVTASAPNTNGSPVTFTATVVGPASITNQAGDNETTKVDSSVAIAPSVLVVDVDADEAPLVGVTVTFTVTAGGGSPTGATTTTNAEGIATVGSWALGPVAGTNRLTATASWPGSPFITFIATATASITR